MRRLFPAVVFAVVCAVFGAEARAQVIDEARQAGRSAQSLPAADEDYFHAMDGGIPFTADEVKGRNMWLVWTGGDDRLWDKLTNLTFGSFDLLKILSSYPGLKYSRDNRWDYFGLVNEPCFAKATGPDPKHYGLWLDQRDPNCPPDPFANATKYPGVAVGARGKNIPAGSYYGEPTGILGLRLFPNPAFDEAAAKRWDPQRFYNDPNYYLSKDLVRPYRVGMACGFCHVSANPEKPPADPEKPQWENLSSTAGAQYFWVDRILAWNADPSNFLFQVLHTARPGSLDTSLVSTDNINNPRTMNAVYNVMARLDNAKRLGRETLGQDNLANKQFNDFVKSGPLTEFYQPPNTVWTPHVLKDGSDSVGVLGALNRVYLNIGLFSEEWLRHFNPVLGGKPVTPIQITTARANSSYWQATEMQTPDMALFLLKASYPHKLKNAPGGSAYLNDPAALVQQGKQVFADNCAACHSSKAPAPPAEANLGACIGPHYLECWNRYWSWTQTDDYRTKMRQIVEADDFLDGNFLSNDARVPVTLLETNACSPLATNAIAGEHLGQFLLGLVQIAALGRHDHGLRPVHRQAATLHDAGRRARLYPRPVIGQRVGDRPLSPQQQRREIRGEPVGCGAHDVVRGFDRSAPVARQARQGRGIRRQDPRRDRPHDGDELAARPDRLSARRDLKRAQSVLNLAVPVFDEKGLAIGPIPAGTPVDLLANFDPLPPERRSLGERLAHDKQVVAAVFKLVHDLRALPKNATDDQARQVFANVGEQLFALSKCPDYVVNRGHYFGAKLSDADKNALIAFLKTF